MLTIRHAEHSTNKVVILKITLTTWLMELGGSMSHLQGPTSNPYRELNQSYFSY